MTLQEIFDKAVAAVIAQGHRSVDAATGWGCRYRGRDGAKCAVGHLIADEHYCSELEGSNISADDVRAAVVLSIGGEIPSQYIWTVLSRLQFAHDTSADDAFVSRFKLKASEAAIAYGLQWNFG